MAGTFKFHSKLHRANHHTISGTNVPDAGVDPIASQAYPFLGVFYTILTDRFRTFNIPTNSYDWWSGYQTVYALSGRWAPTLSLYNTVNSLSNNWNSGFSGYTTLNANSGRYNNVSTAIETYSANWNSPYILFTNVAREYTTAKTFSGTDLTLTESTSTLGWNLDNNQVTFYTLTCNITCANPTNQKNGGIYTLILQQDGNGGHEASFSTAYRFNNIYPGFPVTDGIVNLTPNYKTVITFVSNGTLMFGDPTFYAP